MARKHIQDDDRGYSFALHYVKFATRLCYRSFRVHGWDKVPTDGSVIFVSNHTGSLMDPLVQLTAEGHKVVFMARADVFHKPKVAKILRWLRILPVYRIRDGYAAVKSNDKIIDEAVGVLTDRCPLALYPEGTHRTKHSLMPIKKGIWRIATRAAERLDKPVYIVPVGLDYDDYFRYMKHARVRFGEPIRVYPDTDRAELLQTLHDRIASLITYFPDDDNYEVAYEHWREEHTPKYNTFQKIGRALLAVLSIPFFLVFGVLCAPMWLVAWILSKKVEDHAWMNSLRMVTKVVFLPILALAIGIPAFIFLPWYWAVLILIALLFSHSGFYYLQDFYRSILQKQ